MKTSSHSWALILIAVALAGAGISYHFTLESRFAALEQKLDQNSTALQQYQDSQEAVVATKTAALNDLSKEVDSLAASLEPLGKQNNEESSALSDIRKQVASLQQAQQAQQDSQKKLADYATQIEQIKHDVASQAVTTVAPAPAAVPPPVQTPIQTPIQAPAATTTSAPVATPVQTPIALPLLPTPAISTSHASSTPPPFPPRADNSLDLRPAEINVASDAPIRVLPVALPVALSSNDDTH